MIEFMNGLCRYMCHSCVNDDTDDENRIVDRPLLRVFPFERASLQMMSIILYLFEHRRGQLPDPTKFKLGLVDVCC